MPPSLTSEQLAALIQSPSARQELEGAARLRASLPQRSANLRLLPVDPDELMMNALLANQHSLPEEDLGIEYEAFDDIPVRPSRAIEAARFRVDRGRPPERHFRPDVVPGPQGGPMREIGRTGRFPVLAEVPSVSRREAPAPTTPVTAARKPPEPPVHRRTAYDFLLDDDD